MNGKKETQQGKNLVDAAKKADVHHFVWSTLDETTDPPLDHSNSKVEVDKHLKSIGLPHTSLYTNFYFQNFLAFPNFKVTKADDGSLVADWALLWTDGPIGAYSVIDTGAYVLAIFKDPTTWLGKDFMSIAEVITPRQLVKYIEELSGKKIDLKEKSEQDFENVKAYLPNGQAIELWNNMKQFYKHEGNFGRDPELAYKIYPKTQTFKDFVKENITALLPE